MAPRMLPSWLGKAAPVLMLLLVAFLSMPSDAATKKAAPKGTGNPFDILKGYWSGGGNDHAGQGQSRAGELQGHLYRGRRKRLPDHALRGDRL